MMEAAQAWAAIPLAQRRPGLYWWLSDSWELCKRTLVQIRRPGEVISLVIMQPVLLIVLFGMSSAAPSRPAGSATPTSSSPAS